MGQWVIQVSDDYLIAMLVFITVIESKNDSRPLVIFQTSW